MEEWDPIGIRDREGYQDEYDAYVGVVYTKLMDERASEGEIAKYLHDVAVRRIITTPDKGFAGRCSSAAKTLIALRPQFETH